MKDSEYVDVSMELLEPAKPKDPAAEKIVGHFRKPMKEVASLVVDEAYALQYADLKAEEKIVKKNLEIMNTALKGARMHGEKNIQLGKALLVYNDVDDQTGTDWEAAFRAIVGDPDEPKNAELKVELRKFSKLLRKGYTTCEVKPLA